MLTLWRSCWLALVAALSVGCIATLTPLAQPQQNYQLGRLLLEDSFETVGTWREYEAEAVQMQTANGRFYMRVLGSAYYWTINRFTYEDAVIEVEIRSARSPDISGYGVVCRADPDNNGNGYYFLISDDGSYSIRRGIRREVTALRSWAAHPAIYTDGRPNRLRAVCLGDYLALYVNDTFIADVRDHFFQRGVVGLGAVTTAADAWLEVSFDDLRLWQALPAP